MLWRQQIGWSYCAGSQDSISWHNAMQTKRSLCQQNVVLLVVQRLGVTAVMPMVFGSTLTLPTFVLFFFLCLLGEGEFRITVWSELGLALA